MLRPQPIYMGLAQGIYCHSPAFSFCSCAQGACKCTAFYYTQGFIWIHAEEICKL